MVISYPVSNWIADPVSNWIADHNLCLKLAVTAQMICAFLFTYALSYRTTWLISYIFSLLLVFPCHSMDPQQNVTGAEKERCVPLPEWTGMGLITGMDYRNGHLYVCMCPELLFIRFLRTIRHIAYTNSD